MTTALEVNAVSVGYGRTQVLFEAQVTVEAGEIVTLLGTNGAGKSTLLRCVAGTLQPWSGDVFVNGRRVNGKRPHEIARGGVAMMPGGKATFPALEVSEHFRLAAWNVPRKHANGRMLRALEVFPRLRQRWGERAGSLSGGEQQQLGLAQAIIARPGLLLIDELSLGLAPALVDQLLDVVRNLNDEGATVVIVEQSLTVALAVADRAIFMEKGQVRFDGPAKDLVDRPDLVRSVFLGAACTPDLAPDARRSATGRVVLEGVGLRRAFGGVNAVDDVDIAVRAGEVLAIVGPNGAGKTTLFDLLSGQIQLSGGSVRLAGRDVTGHRPDQLARMGLARSFQDARLFPSLTVAETLCTALDRHLHRVGPFGAVVARPDVERQERWARDRADELLRQLGLQTAADKLVSDLSTGTRRIVDLACAIAHAPTVLLLDEPASGISQREVEALGPVLRQIVTWTGAGVLLIEHDMPLVRAVADRVLVLAEGRVIVEGPPEDALQHPDVIEAYVGSGVASRRSGLHSGSPS